MSTDTLALTEDETNAFRRMFHGEDGDTTTGLRYVEKQDEGPWRRGIEYLLVVTHDDYLRAEIERRQRQHVTLACLIDDDDVEPSCSEIVTVHDPCERHNPDRNSRTTLLHESSP